MLEPLWLKCLFWLFTKSVAKYTLQFTPLYAETCHDSLMLTDLSGFAKNTLNMAADSLKTSWHCQGAGRGDAATRRSLCRVSQTQLNLRNGKRSSRRPSKQSRVLTHSMDRNMIAFAAMTSQRLAQDAPKFVVRWTAMQC